MDALRDNPAHALRQYKKTNADDLAALLRKASEEYFHGENGPVISDEVFDIALDHLRKIAPKHAFLVDVGASLRDSKVQLPFWMGSLDKIKDDGEKVIAKFRDTYPGSYIISHKLDGNSGLLVYKPGEEPKLYSRGDGREGQDLTRMIKHLQLPEKIRANKVATATVAVRGELIISKKNWAAIADKGANARNVVAGVLHAKQPDAAIARRVDFVVYELLEPKMSFQAGLEYMKAVGFNVVHFEPLAASGLTIEYLSGVLVKERDTSEYEIDGIVITHDAEHKIVKGKNPKHAFAFKSILTHEEAEVLVSGVEWRVSKDGYIKPTVLFPPVKLNGVTIQRATGNNAAFIENNKIGVGARIVIIRSGDVIPKVVRVTRPAQPMMPDIGYIWNATHVDIMVAGEEVTPEQKLRNLEHFAKTLNIKHVAVGTLKKLADAGHDSIAALFKLTAADVMEMDGFKKTSATNIVTSLREAKKAACTDMMVASNLFGRGVGERKIKTIVNAFPSILSGEAPSLAELKEVEGVGEATAKGFLSGLSAFFALMEEIDIPCRSEAVGKAKQKVQPKPKSDDKKQVHDFTGAVIVFTGFRNKDWEAAIEAAGGKVASTISGKTTLVVASDPDETSTKLNKARSLGIKIMSKEAFINR